MPASSDPARLALDLAALGWHILPLSPASKRPLGNCGACRPRHGLPAHLAHACPCLAAGGWCHGVRAATTSPATITAWWRREPRAVPGVAAGPSGLVLVDIDAHGGPPPPNLATGLLPGIDLATEPIPRERVGRPGPVPGRPRQPGPAGPAPRRPPPLAHRARAPARHRRHPLRRRAPVVPGPRPQPPPGPQRPPRPLRAGLANRPQSRLVLRHRPRRHHHRGTYPIRGGDPAHPGHMPAWLAREVIRATTTAPRQPATPPPPSPGGPGPAAYLATVIGRGAVQLGALADGRKRALSALAYHAGGLLAWSGADRGHVTNQLIDAGTTAGLGPSVTTRIVNRAITNGIDRPVTGSSYRR